MVEEADDETRDEETASGGQSTGTVDDNPWRQIEADGRDDGADERDASANERDRRADVRDAESALRDAVASDQPGIAEARRAAAHDRDASADDRAASGHDRLRAREDRRSSRWDSSVAEQIRVRLVASLADADKLPETTLLIGQAQGTLMTTVGGDAADALIEIGDRADRDRVGLREASTRILAEAASNGNPAIPGVIAAQTTAGEMLTHNRG